MRIELRVVSSSFSPFQTMKLHTWIAFDNDVAAEGLRSRIGALLFAISVSYGLMWFDPKVVPAKCVAWCTCAADLGDPLMPGYPPNSSLRSSRALPP